MRINRKTKIYWLERRKRDGKEDLRQKEKERKKESSIYENKRKNDYWGGRK